MIPIFEARSEALYVGRATKYVFPLHVHDNVELLFVLSGIYTMRIDGKTYQLQPGDMAVMFPLVPHSFDAISEGAKGFSTILLPDTIAEFTHTFHQLRPERPLIPAETLAGTEVRTLVDRLMATPNEEYSPFRLAELHLLLANLLTRLTLSPLTSRRESNLSTRVMHYTYEHACEPITLESTSKALGVSKSHLSHLFAQQFHINFRQFINAIRIGRAIMLMRDPTLSLTQICDTCGYENMRTFRRAFIHETGMLPSDYMKTVHVPAGEK